MEIINKLKELIESINGYKLDDKRRTNDVVIGRMVFYMLIKKYRLTKNPRLIFQKYTGRSRSATYNIERQDSFKTWGNYLIFLTKCEKAFKPIYEEFKSIVTYCQPITPQIITVKEMLKSNK